MVDVIVIDVATFKLIVIVLLILGGVAGFMLGYLMKGLRTNIPKLAHMIKEKKREG